MLEKKTAWLIGIYTYEMDARMQSLGYRITHNFATPEIADEEHLPDLVVIAEDKITEPPSYKTIKEKFPETLVISLPSESYNALNPRFIPPCKQSITRLLNHLHERFYRWDN